MYLDELPGNCGVAVLAEFSPMDTVEKIRNSCIGAKKERFRFVLATLNDEQVGNLGPKLLKAGFRLVRKGINPMHYSPIYIYIKDLGVYKNDANYDWGEDYQ